MNLPISLDHLVLSERFRLTYTPQSEANPLKVLLKLKRLLRHCERFNSAALEEQFHKEAASWELAEVFDFELELELEQLVPALSQEKINVSIH